MNSFGDGRVAQERLEEGADGGLVRHTADTGEHARQRSTPVLRVVAFGGLTVMGASGKVVDMRPRLVALVGMLAIGKRQSRDRLTALLWPDSSTKQARHSLAQVVYSLRQTLGADVVTSAGATHLALNPSLVGSDVGEFATALERGDRSRAATLYAGPLLDGFLLGDSVEFEHWVDCERARFRRDAVESLEALCREADQAGDHASAVGWWRRLVAIDPTSGKCAAGYMRALARAGERGAAIAHYQAHAETVLRELEAPPDAELTRLVERLRAGSFEVPHALGTVRRLTRRVPTPIAATHRSRSCRLRAPLSTRSSER